MVWGGMSIGGRTDLYVIHGGSLTALKYRGKILRPLVLPYAGSVDGAFFLMDDNERQHKAALVTEMLDEEGIQRMNWPVRSRDLNPIKHAWVALGRMIAHRDDPPLTL